MQPIVIDRDGVIVIGHCRALAAQKLGMEEVPCVCVDDLTPEQVNALRLVDNKSNESDWDFDLLADELPGLDCRRLILTGISEIPTKRNLLTKNVNRNLENEWSAGNFRTMTKNIKSF